MVHTYKIDRKNSIGGNILLLLLEYPIQPQEDMVTINSIVDKRLLSFPRCGVDIGNYISIVDEFLDP